MIYFIQSVSMNRIGRGNLLALYKASKTASPESVRLLRAMNVTNEVETEDGLHRHLTKGTDRYKRTLAVVKVNGQNVNLEMVRLGYAWHYLKYSKNPDLAKAEREAREGKRGLWADRLPVPPWDWRKK